MAQAQSEIRYLTPPSVDIKKKKYCRFKKNGIKYIAPSYHRNFVEISTSYCTSCEKSPSLGAAPLCN